MEEAPESKSFPWLRCVDQIWKQEPRQARYQREMSDGDLTERHKEGEEKGVEFVEWFENEKLLGLWFGSCFKFVEFIFRKLTRFSKMPSYLCQWEKIDYCEMYLERSPLQKPTLQGKGILPVREKLSRNSISH